MKRIQLISKKSGISWMESPCCVVILCLCLHYFSSISYMCHDNCHFDELAVYVFELNFSLGFAVSLYVCSVRFEI